MEKKFTHFPYERGGRSEIYVRGPGAQAKQTKRPAVANTVVIACSRIQRENPLFRALFECHSGARQ